MNFDVIKAVYPSGVAETGLTTIVNDRFTQLRVPWTFGSSQLGEKYINWILENDKQERYTAVVPVYVQNVTETIEGQEVTRGQVTYQQGDYFVLQGVHYVWN